jgi:hypothetical protein
LAGSLDDLHHFAAQERAVGELQAEDGTAAATRASDHERQAGRKAAQNVIDDAGARRPHLSPFLPLESGRISS